MKTYILDSINRLKRLGENLDAKTILCNKSWQIFNDTGEKELYIFQENGDILLSTNGIVSQGRWQYIYANKTILISIKENSYLLHPSFSINNIMAMNLDGTERYMLMIEEQSLLALQLKSIKDLNNYFLSLEESEKQKEYKCEEEELKLRAIKAWAISKNTILNSDEEYKHKKKLSVIYFAACFFAPTIALLSLMNIWNKEFEIVGIFIVLLAFLFPIVEACIYESKCSEISGRQQKIFIENYINNNRNK